MKTVAVIFGGKSVEHDISIITAMQALANMPKEYKVIPIYINHDGRFLTADNLNKAEIYLNFNKKVKNLHDVSVDFVNKCFVILKNNKIKNRIKIDCALLCNHGHGGEDGSLQGMLDLLEIPYSSSSVASSALTMDKTLTKIMLQSSRIKTLPYVQFDKCQYKQNKLKILHSIKKNLRLPCIIKPATLGSSVGISICECETKLESEIEKAFEYDNRILVEKFLSNAKEYSCAIVKINGKSVASKVCEVKKSKIYTFEEKYLRKRENTKSQIDKSLNEKIQNLAIKSYTALRCDGVVRIDFLLEEKSQKLYVNELNSIPGSLSFNMFDGSFEDMITLLIEEGIEKNQAHQANIYQFSSDAIESFIKLSHNGFKKIK